MASKKKSNGIKPQIITPIPAVPLGGGFGRDLANWLFPGFLAMIILGHFCIWKWGSAPGNPNPVRSLFLAMNAATLSGFNEAPGMQWLNPFGQWVCLVLIVGGSLFTMIVGGLAVIRIARLPFTDRELIFSAFVVEASALVIGTSLLLMDTDRLPFQALFLAATSFGNCGLYIATLPKPDNWLVHAVILPMSVLGGLGLPVLMELGCSLIFRAKISVHTRTVVAATAWLYIIGLLLLLALNFAGRGVPSMVDLRTQVPSSSILAIESRTGGLAIASVKDLSQPAKWILVTLMMIGASSAGTGGGLKTTTVAELARGAKKLLAGQPVGRSFAIAFVWLAIYLGLILGAVLLLAYVSGSDPGDSIFFNAVSGISNVGFTPMQVPDQKNIMFAYCAIILVGRMAPLMVLWWMAETTSGAELAIG